MHDWFNGYEERFADHQIALGLVPYGPALFSAARVPATVSGGGTTTSIQGGFGKNSFFARPTLS